MLRFSQDINLFLDDAPVLRDEGAADPELDEALADRLPRHGPQGPCGPGKADATR